MSPWSPRQIDRRNAVEPPHRCQHRRSACPCPGRCRSPSARPASSSRSRDAEQPEAAVLPRLSATRRRRSKPTPLVGHDRPAAVALVATALDAACLVRACLTTLNSSSRTAWKSNMRIPACRRVTARQPVPRTTRPCFSCIHWRQPLRAPAPVPPRTESAGSAPTVSDRDARDRFVQQAVHLLEPPRAARLSHWPAQHAHARTSPPPATAAGDRAASAPAADAPAAPPRQLARPTPAAARPAAPPRPSARATRCSSVSLIACNCR